MRFAKLVFLIAGIYGLIVLLPQYFLETIIARNTPPPITHPEYFYGFVGVSIAFQVLFLVISRDPVKYRAMMVPAVLEKASFLIAVIALYALNRVPVSIFVPAGLDGILGVLFVVSFIKVREADK